MHDVPDQLCVRIGFRTIIATSWHCSTRRNNDSGASLGLKSDLNNLSLFHIEALLGLPKKGVQVG
jgi:hypothetical protein